MFNFYLPISIATIDLLLRRTLVRSVNLIITCDVYYCYQLLFHSTKPTPSRSQQNHFSTSPLQGGDGLQLHEDTYTMLNKVLNDAVSDTTKDDSSKLADYIIINFILKN